MLLKVIRNNKRHDVKPDMDYITGTYDKFLVLESKEDNGKEEDKLGKIKEKS